MPPMPSMPLPPGMGVLQAMGIMGGPPPPGIRMAMEPPGVSSGMAQDDPQKMAQRASQVCVYVCVRETGNLNNLIWNGLIINSLIVSLQDTIFV